MTTELADLLAIGAVALSLVVPALALVVRRRAPATAVAMVLTAAGTVAALLLPDPAWARACGLLTGMLLAPVVVLTYPRLRVSHPVDFLALVTVAGAAVLAVTAPETVDTMGFVVLLVLIGHVWWSLERARGAERRATTWLALTAGTSTLAAGILGFAVSGAAPAPAWVLVPYVVLGPGLLLGLVRPDAADARELVVDLVAHASTAVVVLGVFVGVAAPLQEARPGSDTVGLLGLVAAALAAAYHPTRRVLRTTVAQVVLGPRPDPLTAVGMVTARVGDEPALALDAVRRALVLPWAAVLAEPPLTAGARPEAVVRVPLGDGLPELEVGLRPEETRLSRAEERLLALAAPLLGQSVRLHALAVQLQGSREQTVRALEQERSRLRRDLHDGLGPLLSGLAFTTDAASNLVRHDPDAAVGLLADVRAQAQTALDDVRRLVYGMRPPALDELGLVGALRQATRDLPSPVSIEGPARLDLTAAVEVAAYRIVVEAVTNATRHAPAAQVEVALAVDGDRLRLTVSDDGHGTGEWHRGVGLSSMRERAAEVGGSVHAGPTPAGGRVTASLPR